MIQPVLETERLRLRPLDNADTALIALYAGDQRVARMTRSIPHPLPPGATEAFIARVLSGAAKETVWAMDHKGSRGGELVGLIGLQDDGEIGYWVGAPFWETGFATEAVGAVVTHALSAGDHDLLRAEVFQDNPASARVLTKAGFVYTGEGRAHATARDAEVSVWCYELARRP